MPKCPMCTNGDGEFLGVWCGSDRFRCRDCGWDWSEPSQADEEEDEEDDEEPEEPEEPEWDGQPDEAQEWHDFDPDC